MNNTHNSQATANRRFAGACGWKKANERRYYLRRCRRCSNFMNWLVRPDGTARCQDCGENQTRAFGVDLHQELMGNVVFLGGKIYQVFFFVCSAHTPRNNMVSFGIPRKGPTPRPVN